MAEPITLGAVAIGPSDGDPIPLLAEAARGVAELAAAGARLALLPEIFAHPYVAGDDPTRWRHLAEPLDGPTGQWARRTAVDHGIAILYGILLQTVAGRPLNAAVLARPDARLQVAATKIHLPPSGPGDRFGEADHVAEGPPDVATIDIDGTRLAVLICHDRRFPECWRQAAAKGAEAVLVLVAGDAPNDPPGIFEAEIRTHARANAVYALAAARYGTEVVLGQPMTHDGLTLAAGPEGALDCVLAGSGTLRLTLDPARIARRRPSGATAAELRLGRADPPQTRMRSAS